MMSYGKSLLMAATAVIATATLASVASAANVSLTVSGAFTSGGTATGSGATLTAANGGQITYVAAAPQAITTFPSMISLGSFTVANLPSTGNLLNDNSVFSGAGFTLTLTQSPSVGGAQQTIGSVTGVLSNTGSNGALFFNFAPASLSFTSIQGNQQFTTTYTDFFGTLATSNGVAPAAGTVGNQLTASALQGPGGPITPLPPAALAGAALFGFAGLKRLRRKSDETI